MSSDGSVNLKNEIRVYADRVDTTGLPVAPGKRIRARKDGSRREKRSINRVRNAMALMLERNAPQFDDWLQKAAEQSPLKALVLMKDLSEYFMPKLGRQEITLDATHKVQHFVAISEREERPVIDITPEKPGE